MLILKLLNRTIKGWLADRAQTEGAALAFFATMSVAPLLVLVLAVAGVIYGREALQGNIVSSISRFVGAGPAESIQELLKTAAHARTGWAALIGSVGALIGASAGFIQLHDSLNRIWGVVPRADRGTWGVIRDRFYSYVTVLCGGLIIIALLAASVVISTLTVFFKDSILGGETLLQVMNTLASFSIFTLIFMLIFKFVPDVKIQWKEVWLGAMLTAVLFEVGKFLIGLYLGKSGTTTTYGAAGSLALLLLWTYYCAQILFLGAEFTKIYALQSGRPIEASANAIPLKDVLCNDSQKLVVSSAVVRAAEREAANRQGKPVETPVV